MAVRGSFISLTPLLKIWSPIINRCYSSIYPTQTKIEDANEKEQNSRKLKKWRNEESADPSELVDDPQVMSAISPNFSPANFQSWYKAQQLDYVKWNYRYIDERNKTLGNDLAATHYVLHRGGKVRQKGTADFLYPDDLVVLPRFFTPNWAIEEIDFSNSEICYEGLCNFKNIKSLRKFSFRGCKYFDDWCLEKLMCICPDIQYLDVSDCRDITERGIEGLYRVCHLKHLVVTDFGHGAAFELTCLMLEDIVPGLTVEIVKIPENNEDFQK